MKQTLKGTLIEARHDDREATIDLAPDCSDHVNIQVTWKADSRADAQMEHLYDGMAVKAKVKITGWASMPYPHLSSDEMSGKLVNIKEIDHQ